jgi:hypothetical protein
MVGVIETRCRYKRDGGTYACERERVGGGGGGDKSHDGHREIRNGVTIHADMGWYREQW